MSNRFSARFLGWQLGLTLVAVLLASVIWLIRVSVGVGQPYGPTLLSSILGGLAVVLPSLLFVGHWHLTKRLPSVWSGALLLLGEGLRLVMVLVLLAVIPQLWSGVVWWAYLLGLVLVVQAHYVQLIMRDRFDAVGERLLSAPLAVGQSRK